MGICAIEMAEGKPPHYDMDAMKALAMIGKGNYKPPKLTEESQWSPNFHKFLQMCLVVNPKKRSSSQEALFSGFCCTPELKPDLLVRLIEFKNNVHREKIQEDKIKKLNALDAANVVEKFNENLNYLYQKNFKDEHGDFLDYLNQTSSHLSVNNIVPETVLNEYCKHVRENEIKNSSKNFAMLVQNSEVMPYSKMGAMLFQISHDLPVAKINCATSYVHPGSQSNKLRIN